MLAREFGGAAPQQVFGETPAILAEALTDGTNLVVWQRRLASPVAAFAQTLVRLNKPLAESLTVDIEEHGAPQPLPIAAAYCALTGYADFIADVSWLISAFACLIGARRVGLRLRILDKAMCPRFHVDHVPLRLITTYAGAASQWLKEDAMPRSRLGEAGAEPQLRSNIEQLDTGSVALFKGEKWSGNEGAGIVHRSPQPMGGERRLILTLDWLS